MINRCNQIIDCRDESDEQDCKLLVLKDGYNNIIPPFTLVSISFIQITYDCFSFQDEHKTILHADVNISSSLETVIDISESSHTIELKFQMILEWYEHRAKYYNIKRNSALNVLPKKELSMLWMPYVIFKVLGNKSLSSTSIISLSPLDNSRI